MHLLRSLMASASLSTKHSTSKPNRLIHEKSPYLQQHAYNPVDWYPWGKEAFEKAKLDDKMIFLSVGYSTCHWCHVMERESFEMKNIGEILNENFVNIKVDREERPDVDKMYMGFVQATTGGGGWPMSVWLTPDLKPVVGGTYFPPEGQFGRPGFSSILQHIAKKWREDKAGLMEQGTQMLDAVSKMSSKANKDEAVLQNAQQCAKLCQEYFASSYDSQWGGFGDEPKFPQPSNFDFLTHYYAYKEGASRHEDSATLKMVDFTMKCMAKGGIHDHISQGFHRYSTDEQWHVPHFEKMLYDQAQLVVTFADMYKITKDKFHAEMVRDILTYVDRDLSHALGGFFSAEDADSLPNPQSERKLEGAFCVWTEQEIRKFLGAKVAPSFDNVTLADVFCAYYTIKLAGNVNPNKDPHGELKGKNVLIVHSSIEDVAKKFTLDVETTENALKEARKILFAERLKRPKPHLDTKILTAWNGLMISGFFRAAIALDDKAYGVRGEKALKFLRHNLYNQETRRLLRSCYVDDQNQIVQIKEPISAFADDYAYLIAALLDAYDYTLNDENVKWACELQSEMDQLFFNGSHETYGAYYQCPDDASILMRLIEDHDGAEPNPNSIAVMNNVRLFNLTGVNNYKQRAGQILTYFGKKLRTYPFTQPKMMCGLMAYDTPCLQIIIAGPEDDEEMKNMIRLVHASFLPYSITVLLDGKTDAYLIEKNEHLKMMADVPHKKAAAYVCSDFACQRPVYNAKDLHAQLFK